MLKGKGISEGIGIGRALVISSEEIQPEKKKVADIEAEKKRVYQAVDAVKQEMESLLETLEGTEKEIMQAYVWILQDPTLVAETIQMIEKDSCDAVYATEMGFQKMIQTFKEMEDAYMADRSADIADMKKRVLYKLLRKEEQNLAQLPPHTIVVAKELTTSDTAKLDLQNVAGMITELGGKNSHMAIMARTHEIPGIVGIQQSRQLIKEGDYIAMNGKTGEVFVNPSEKEIQALESIQAQRKQEKEQLETYKQQLSTTKDGHTVELLANIGGPQDIEMALQNTAEGVGLFRSEFLYMFATDFPTEEEQFEAYKKVAERFQGKKVIIRTLDIGGDKEVNYMQLPKEANPFLGYRAIRIFLEDIPLFKVQLRAILRASGYGNLAIMLPMISSIEELREAKRVLEEVKEELKLKQIAFQEDIPLGIMIEIPAAAIMAEELARECDFFSIGTNDLVQYTTAVERGNEKVANLYTHFHPAIIRLIHSTIKGAHTHHIFCGMCGEAAGDPLLVPVLLGLGLDEFSMNATAILQTRKRISELTLEECKKLAEEVLTLSSAEEVRRRLEAFQKDKATKG